MQSVWVEIATPKNQKPILVGCIYKHPGANIDEFNGKLDETMNKLFNPNKYQLYILGDMNIDFFKCDSHPPTEAYLDMLYSNNLLPIITKPTRLTHHSATLIDHIYTNSTSKIVSVSLITSQLSVLQIYQSRNTTLLSIRDRDYSNFDQESYLWDINAVNWNAIYSNDLHETATKITDLIKSIADKHAPVRQLSQKKQKLCTKPWITNGILKSIKTKHKLYKTHFLSKNPIKVTEYKKYAYKLNWPKNICKKNYFSQHFDLCKNNLKASWKLIGMLVKSNSKGQTPSKTKRNNRAYTLIRLRLPFNLISILSMWVKTWPKELKIVMEVRPNS